MYASGAVVPAKAALESIFGCCASSLPCFSSPSSVLVHHLDQFLLDACSWYTCSRLESLPFRRGESLDNKKCVPSPYTHDTFARNSGGVEVQCTTPLHTTCLWHGMACNILTFSDCCWLLTFNIVKRKGLRSMSVYFILFYFMFFELLYAMPYDTSTLRFYRTDRTVVKHEKSRDFKISHVERYGGVGPCSTDESLTQWQNVSQSNTKHQPPRQSSQIQASHPSQNTIS
jgi:hypothetical protein